MSWALVKSKSARKRAACRGPQQEHRKKTATLPNRPRHRWSSGPAEDLARILTLENALPPRRYCNRKRGVRFISAKPRPHLRVVWPAAVRNRLGKGLRKRPRLPSLAARAGPPSQRGGEAT